MKQGLSLNSTCIFFFFYIFSNFNGRSVFSTANATCLETRCSEGLSCLINPVNHQPLCAQCKTRTCSPLSRYKVCGTDGVDYKNYCVLMRASCKMGLAIDTRHSGSCDSKKTAYLYSGVSFYLTTEPNPNQYVTLIVLYFETFAEE